MDFRTWGNLPDHTDSRQAFRAKIWVLSKMSRTNRKMDEQHVETQVEMDRNGSEGHGKKSKRNGHVDAVEDRGCGNQGQQCRTHQELKGGAGSVEAPKGTGRESAAENGAGGGETRQQSLVSAVLACSLIPAAPKRSHDKAIHLLYLTVWIITKSC